MKVAFLCSSPSWGGLEINNLKLCAWLMERGHEPLLFCLPEHRIAKEASQKKIKVVSFEHRKKHVAFRSASRLAKLLATQGINQVVIGHYRHFYIAVWSALFSLVKIQVIYWQHMKIVLKRKDPYHAFFFNRLDAWVAPLHYLKAQVMENTTLREEKIKVIPLGIPLSVFEEAAGKQAEARKLFALPKEVFLIGTIGRIDKMKGQEYVLQVAHLLKAKGETIHVAIIGEESFGQDGYLSELKRKAQELDIENQVHFRPFTSQVEMAFACLDIFIMSTLSESIGMVTVEAMATGVPVVGTNSGGTPELLDNGRAGLLFEPEDPVGLASQILLLSQSLPKRQALSALGKKRAQLYSHETECMLFEELLTELGQAKS